MNAEQSHGIPRIGTVAPDFRATTTHGELHFSEWQADDWVVFFSHPADFTPVCATELGELARRHQEFESRRTKLLGLSVDSVRSHLAWRENLRHVFDVDIDFPIVADVDMKVASLYGMVHPGDSVTSTVRAVFVVDPRHVVRALVYYPLDVGRSVDEILRLLDGLQTVDANACALPVNWKPGDKVFAPPPRTAEDVSAALANEDYERLAFYINKRTL